MLTDNARKEMQPIKQTYLDSMIADADSFADGVKERLLLKSVTELGANNIKRIYWKNGKWLIDYKNKTLKQDMFETLKELLEFVESDCNN